MLKIAIYSGDIPSTTFIERLIHGLSNSDQKIYLFGFKKAKVSYNTNVSVFAYNNTKFHKALHLIKYSLLLLVFKPKEKFKLDRILAKESNKSLLNRVKFYPVLWHKPDVFHIQWAKSLKDWIWLHEFGIKVVLSLRGAHINYSPITDLELARSYRKLFPKVDAFHAVSRDIASEAQNYGAKKENIKVVYSGLDFKQEPVQTTNKNKTFEIISVGRSHWIKGYSDALDACKILKDAGFNYKYTIIGGSKSIELVYQVQDLGLEDFVELMDQKPFPYVQDCIRNVDLMLLSSSKEGIANVVLEAMALQTLVLSTNCGGVAEVITDGENGFLTPIRNSKLMAKAVLDIAALSEDFKERIRINAYNTIKDQHNLNHMIDDMLELYETLF